MRSATVTINCLTGEKLSKSCLGLLRSPATDKGKQAVEARGLAGFLLPSSTTTRGCGDQHCGSMRPRPPGDSILCSVTPRLQSREGRAGAAAMHSQALRLLRAALCLLPAGLREVNWKREKAKRKPGVLRPSPKSAFFSIY